MTVIRPSGFYYDSFDYRFDFGQPYREQFNSVVAVNIKHCFIASTKVEVSNRGSPFRVFHVQCSEIALLTDKKAFPVSDFNLIFLVHWDRVMSVIFEISSQNLKFVLIFESCYRALLCYEELSCRQDLDSLQACLHLQDLTTSIEGSASDSFHLCLQPEESTLTYDIQDLWLDNDEKIGS